MSYIKHLDNEYFVVRLVKYWRHEQSRPMKWRYQWYIKRIDQYNADWELSDFCNVNKCELVCITRGWFTYYATLKVIK